MDFRLATPQVGEYACREAKEGGKTLPFEFLPGNGYRFGKLTGSYTLTDVVEDKRGKIDWIGGPFDDETSWYSEEEGTGLREFRLNRTEGSAFPTGYAYSKSELAFACEAVGQPLHYPKYGAGSAPAPQAGTTALDGMYYRLDPVYNASPEPTFYRFFPNGYVFIGTPNLDDLPDCTRTKPNGAPFCKTYRVVGNTITLTDENRTDTTPFSLDEGVPVIDDDPLQLVTASPERTLEGIFQSSTAGVSGFCGAYSQCSSHFSQQDMEFTKAGRFTFTSSSLTSMSSALGSNGASDSSSSVDTGTYTLDGHAMELRFNNGKIERKFYFRDTPDTFILGDRRFGPPEDDKP